MGELKVRRGGKFYTQKMGRRRQGRWMPVWRCHDFWETEKDWKDLEIMDEVECINSRFGGVQLRN